MCTLILRQRTKRNYNYRHQQTYAHIRIDKQLVKKKKIKIEPMNRLFEVFNADGTKNREVT